MILGSNIVKENVQSLHEISKPVELPLSDEDRNTLLEMFMYLINSQNPEKAKELNLRPGVGLAAPQIGVNKCMFAVFAENEEGKLFTLLVVNPKIIQKSKELTYLPGGEGCLSVDRQTCGITPRHKTIKVDCHLYNLKTQKLEHKIFSLKDYIAIVFQHEFDHLLGTLFVDKLMEEKEANQKGIKPLWEEEND